MSADRGAATVNLPSTLSTGKHELRAVFTPTDDVCYASATATTSLTVTAAPTKTQLRLSPGTAHFGQPGRIAVHATVSLGVSGRVDFHDGTRRLGSVAVRRAAASLTLPRGLSAGTHRIRAVFSPSGTAHAPSQTQAVLTVRPRPTTTTLKLTRTTQSFGRNRATARVAVAGGPAGRVAIWDGRRRLATVVVVRGSATYKLPARLKRGTHRVLAEFAPANPGQHTSSTSTTVKLRIR